MIDLAVIRKCKKCKKHGDQITLCSEHKLSNKELATQRVKEAIRNGGSK